MNARRGARAAVSVALLALVLMAANVILRGVYPEARGSIDGLTLLPMVVGLAVVGGLIAARRPENPYGWVLLFAGLAWAVNSITIDYAALAIARSLHGADAAAVAAAATGAAAWGTFVTFVLLLYPTGRLPSPRWRWGGWAAGLGLAFMTVGLTASAMSSGAAEVVAQFLSGEGVRESGWAEILNGIGHLGVFGGMVAGVVGLVVRALRADAVERLQLKWFALGAGLVAGSILVQFIPDTGFLSWLEIVSLSAMPVVIGVAITRWHLYDIDRIISRTLAYAVLTVLLVGIYLAAVTALTAITAPVTGESPIAVAAATLLAAAVFQPARRRIQSAVDRRFNRARYDGRRTVEAFASSLRQEVDLDDVREHLVDTVDDVLKPARITVWLQSGATS